MLRWHDWLRSPVPALLTTSLSITCLTSLAPGNVTIRLTVLRTLYSKEKPETREIGIRERERVREEEGAGQKNLTPIKSRKYSAVTASFALAAPRFGERVREAQCRLNYLTVALLLSLSAPPGLRLITQCCWPESKHFRDSAIQQTRSKPTRHHTYRAYLNLGTSRP